MSVCVCLCTSCLFPNECGCLHAGTLHHLSGSITVSARRIGGVLLGGRYDINCPSRLLRHSGSRHRRSLLRRVRHEMTSLPLSLRALAPASEASANERGSRRTAVLRAQTVLLEWGVGEQTGKQGENKGCLWALVDKQPCRTNSAVQTKRYLKEGSQGLRFKFKLVHVNELSPNLSHNVRVSVVYWQSGLSQVMSLRSRKRKVDEYKLVRTTQ